MPRERQF